MAVTAAAKHDPEVCATHSLRTQEEIFLHQRSLAHGLNRHSNAAATTGDFGEIAVLDDSDGVVARRNPFNLQNMTVAFVPGNAAASSYTFQTTPGTYDSAAASAGTQLLLTDDDTHVRALPFVFPYFGATYQQIYINSDGNLTFTAGDPASTDRSLGRFDEGQPRIAVLYTDLNPEMSKQGVYVTSTSDHFVVSWVAVPPYSPHGPGTPQTFQVRLYPTGRIEMTWTTVTISDLVVGISPGKLSGTASLVSFSQPSTQSFTSAVAERFAGADAVDVVTTSQRFYESHEDAYDYLVIFNSEGIAATQDIQSYELTTRSTGLGYGAGIVQTRGSVARLQSVLNMGPLNQYPSDPHAVLSFRSTTGDTTLTLLGHQAGHLFLAYVSVADPTNAQASPMLGRSGAHWSFYYDSEASLLEGNRIVDQGETASPRFLTTGVVEGYSPLDQYLMGFRLPAEVPDTFWVGGATPSLGVGQPPQKGVAFDGQRHDVKVDDVIAAAGRRTPDATVAQRHFRFAFILIVPAGQAPDPGMLAQLDNYRTEFETAFGTYTSNRAVAETTLKKALHLSTFPASGILTGSTVMETITLEQPAKSTISVVLTASSGTLSVAPSVTIPVSATSVSFPVKALSAGVAQLTAQPSDSSYETAVNNIQASAVTALQLQIVSGDKQAALAGAPLAAPVVVKLTDVNAPPYPGLDLKAIASGGGKVEAELVTDASGLASFHWTLGTDSPTFLTISLPNKGPTLKATAYAKPAFEPGSVVNAASYAVGLCPGAIATIFGTHLDSATVTVNGENAPVFYSAAGQVNFLVPADIAVGKATLRVTNGSGASNSGNITVAALQPGLFAAVNQGTYAAVYGTGLGPLTGNTTVQQPQVTVAGSSATVLYSGVAPGFPGLDQVNVLLPKGASSTAAVVLTIGGLSSNAVKMQ